MPQALAQALQAADEIILDKQTQLRLAFACLLADGDLLIEDLPGVGKTTLAHLLARLLGLQLQRIQFTADLLPADIVGCSIYEHNSGTLNFRPGPIFAQFVLADEINRATPKAQSALLEAMEERQVTVEGETRPLPRPFFVIATQNPDTQIGTFPLPESQLDRFLMRIEMGYPSAAAERMLLQGESRRSLLQRLQPALNAPDLLALQQQVPRIHASAALIDYVQALLAHTRTCGHYRVGLSPRAGLALLRAAQAWALLNNRDAVYPEDVQAVFPSVANHRLHPNEASLAANRQVGPVAILQQVSIP
ncbi:AAA family ATPase [Alkalilimnicola ehrlichii]|uniref:AAA family ATPase n=1 Tax=Alkalilimnicola ehrlichii TaxID=351052 RepID=A0A3E0WPC3_9GAMM|nr:MoxR family ATPase [Alkalilimnicola ehrlichii]RFA28224.1 AAA family ATPase [Alkalilimnicola ehrlichii]RFA34824.1 AAA family ATPase [Alkalilimnicola ehrlichii]